MRVRRSFTALVDGARIKTAQFEGRDHLVVPVVMLVGDSVLRPMHSETGEFVPADLLAEAPEQWDGRPVIATHPDDGLGSANRPRTLERMRFGTVFGTRWRRGALQAEAWIDAARAEAIGGDALDALTALRQGETVEVSVGAWVTLVEEEGRSPSGTPYGARWSSLASDHLAVGLAGHEGACSVEMGCGAPRAAQRATLRAAEEKMEKSAIARAFDRFLEVFRLNQGLSDSDVHSLLWDSLRSAEPAFDGIVEVFQSDGLVVYHVSPEGESQFLQRSFSIGDDGEVTLGKNAKQVAPQTRFEPLTAEAQPEPEPNPETKPSARPCGCSAECKCAEEQPPEPPAAQPKANSNGGESATKGDKPRKEAPKMSASMRNLVSRLITSDLTPFTGDDEEALTTLGEEKLKAMEAKLLEEPYIAPEPEPEPAPLTEEEWLDAAPPKIREMVRRYQDEDAERRNLMLNSLVRAQSSYTRKQLETKPTEELESLCGLLRIHAPKRDYSGRGLVGAQSHSDDGVPEPPSMGRYLRALAAGKSRDDAMREARGN